jgi:hypothetical protein
MTQLTAVHPDNGYPACVCGAQKPADAEQCTTCMMDEYHQRHNVPPLLNTSVIASLQSSLRALEIEQSEINNALIAMKEAIIETISQGDYTHALDRVCFTARLFKSACYAYKTRELLARIRQAIDQELIDLDDQAKDTNTRKAKARRQELQGIRTMTS